MCLPGEPIESYVQLCDCMGLVTYVALMTIVKLCQTPIVLCVESEEAYNVGVIFHSKTVQLYANCVCKAFAWCVTCQ
jgi:hypothetical protein